MNKKELEIGTGLYLKESVYKTASSILSIHPPGARGRKQFNYTVLINGVEIMLSANQIFLLFDLDRKVDVEAKENLDKALERAKEDKKKLSLEEGKKSKKPSLKKGQKKSVKKET